MTAHTEPGAVKRWLINRIREDDNLIGIFAHDETGEKFVHIDRKFVLASDFDALIEQRDRMRLDLMMYGKHTNLCDIRNYPKRSMPCSCGLADAIASSGERGK
jgi:hypothetical protein